ncbi:MAG: DUF4981 domain-containing protein [Prevotella sp.]|nr:DUF4981 domain-containing protein [Prevotella sp.]
MKTCKRLTTVILGILLAFDAEAQLMDAFKGIYPGIALSRQMSLNGTWKLQVIRGISHADGTAFARPDFDDSAWKTIPVPGNWDVHGFCEPRYVEPDSLTGYYRTAFEVPQHWRRDRIILRLDGVLRAYTLYVNGREAGRWESSYNTCLFDITPFLTKNGPQTLALRVVSRFKGFDFDTYDDWAPMGIFRDVTLLRIPEKHLSDFTVTTERISNGTADVRFAFAAGDAKGKRTTSFVIKAQVTDKHGATVENFTLPLDKDGKGHTTLTLRNPHLWTAETPDLYTIRFSLWQKNRLLQQFDRRFGVRQITIDGKTIKLNGRPIKLRGVTSHATDPATGKVISDQLTLKDLRLMKEASINYIRCSHYTREPRFFELCDSLGFYVIDEVSFGHGDHHLNDTAYRDILLTHADATIRRDKNHPCVILWSIGNENPFTPMTGEVGQYALRLDPSREICYPQIGSYFHSLKYRMPDYVKVFAPHYPSLSRLETWAKESQRPIILTEYCHTLGQSLEDHDRLWELMERNDVLAGGSVWEWVDQGMPFRRHLKSKFGYVEDVYTSEEGGFTMYGNKGTDGLLYADRTPLPNYFEVQHNYARAFVTDTLYSLPASGGMIDVHLANRYDFLNLKDNVTFTWALTADRDTIQRGSFSPECAPRQRNTHPVHIKPMTLPDGKHPLLLLHFTIADRTGLVFNRQTVRANPTDICRRLLKAQPGQGSPAAFIVGKPMMRTGRKLTISEGLQVKDDVSNHYLKPITDGLKTDSVAGGWHVSFHFSKDKMPKLILEGGLALLLDAQINKVQWLGYGPYATYPGKQNANRYGLHTMTAGDLYFEGNRMGVDAALLTNEAGKGLLLICHHASGVNFEQTDRGIVLSVNGCVSGLGPKFSKTSHPVRQQDVSGDFYLLSVDASNGLSGLFVPPSAVRKAWNPYLTQYDTYLMRFNDIYGDESTEDQYQVVP